MPYIEENKLECHSHLLVNSTVSSVPNRTISQTSINYNQI